MVGRATASVTVVTVGITAPVCVTPDNTMPVAAVMFVVLATVLGKVAARNPVGWVYVAMRLVIAASR